MANAVVNRQVNVYINSGEAAKAYDVLIKREKLLNAELEKTTDPRRMQQLRSEIDKLKEPIDRAAKKMRGELAPSIRDLEQATRKFLAEFKKTGSPETLAQFQKFRAELDKAKAQLNNLDGANKGLTSKGVFSGAFWGSFLAGGVTAALGGLQDLFGGAVQEALDADQATRMLQSTLDNMGRGDAFDRITRKADEMAKKFRYLDNDDVVGVFNKLIDYGKLTENEINKLLPVIIDFAAKSQISIDESADVIIKALGGNAKALKQYGINIKDAGSETERLNVIMTTLKEKVDGSGEAFQNSAKGGIMTARQELKNLQEDIGNKIIPILNTLLGWVVKALNGLKTFFSNVREGFKGAFRIKGVIKGAIDDAFEDYKENFRDELIKAGQTVQDIIDAENDKRLLGTGSAAEKADKASAKVTKKALERIDLLAQAWKRVLEIQEKGAALVDRIGEKNADVFKKTDELIRQQLRLLDIYFKEEKKQQPADGVTGNDPNAVNQRFAANRLAKLDLAVMMSRGKEKLKAELALLAEQERQELEAKDLTEAQKLVIENKYRELRRTKEREYIASTIEQFASYAATVAGIFSIFDQMATQRENAELQRDAAINNRKKANLESRLRSGRVTQLQYDREIQKMERDQEKRKAEIEKRQFERNKRAQIAQAIIDGAMAVSMVFRTVPKVIPGTIIPNPEFPIILGATILKKLETIAFIAGQKPPQLAAGGRLGGRSHAQGGNAVVDGSGRKIAEVEAGEGIVNKRTMADRRGYTLSGTPSQIISRLNGLHGVQWDPGARLIPGWRNYQPQPMNFQGMRKIYASGGVFSEKSANEASDNAIFENIPAVLSDMQATLASLTSVLASGIRADVSLIRFEKQQARLDSIRDDATMRG